MLGQVFFCYSVRSFLLAILLGLLPYFGQGQPYFSRRYTNPTVGAQTAFTTIAVRDSGFLAVGIAYNYPVGVWGSLCLQFLAPDGQPERVRYYSPGATPGEANALQRLPDGGYILSTQYVPDTFPLTRFTKLWRFNALGDTLWTRQWTRQRGENPQSLCELPDGGFALVGGLSIGPAAAGATDLVLTRTDSAGHVLWEQTYNNLLQDRGYTVSACLDGGFLLGGFSYNGGQYDTFVVKTDSLGQEQWRRTFGTATQNDLLAAVCALRDGTYIVATNVGTRQVNGTQLYRYDVHHLDSAGQTIWSRRLGPEGRSNELYTTHELADGSIVIAGQQNRLDGSQRPEAIIFKLCADGDTLWYRTHRILNGPDSHNYLRDLRPTPDGGFVAAGFLFSRPPDTGANDGWVFRLDSAGYIVAGGAPVTRSCRPTVGLPQDEEGLAGATVWPNPAPDGRFTLALPAGSGRRTLRVTDALGRLVWRGEAAEGETPLPLGGLAPGLYWLRATGADGHGQSWKLVR